ncbi:hypothetical protein WME99_02460 [Sorangium sp. So ce136]|uniref:hypothetical protein n=1 Tax=Sorangium sp. So ce136 TaxID=3133284 RepID=UPI003F0DF2EB
MISVAVKVETTCGICRMPMPVNTLAREVGCLSCGRPTVIGGELWQALLRDPLYNGPRLLPNEVRRSWAGKLSAHYSRRRTSCQGCDKEIPVASIREVRDQAMLRCDRCAKETWVRIVPAELAGVLPSITHLVSEDPDPLAGATSPQGEAATFPCPQCGSPVAFDGVNRACTCRFCGASAHVSDEFVYRGRRRVVAHWYLCFHPSVVEDAPAAQAVAAGLFDWEEPPEVAVDAEGNLYFAATPSYYYYASDGDVREAIHHVLWSVDPSLSIRWIQRDRLHAARFVRCVKDTLLVIDAGGSPQHWLSSRTGTPVESGGAATPMADVGLMEQGHLSYDPAGSLLIQKDGKLRRIAPTGVEVPVWVNSAGRNNTDEHPTWGPSDLSELPDCPIDLGFSLTEMQHGPDASLYLLATDTLARFDAGGRKIYCIRLDRFPEDGGHRVLDADLHGNAYIVCSDRVVRVSAAGEQSAVLLVERDALPRSKMSLAVCPDGTFWLFGEKGLAWKFEPGGRLLFASENEPRPRKPTMEDLVRQRAEASRAQYGDLLASMKRAGDEDLKERSQERLGDKIGCALGVLMAIAMFLLLAWYRSQL